LVWVAKSEETLDKIAAALPDCPCGGKFAPNCGPNCVHCGKQIEIVADAIEYLGNPFMVAVDGACVFIDRHDPYRVRIVDSS